MRHCQTTLAILAALSASIALADDFKTIDGKEYKNVTVSRVEPDGVVIKFSGGIVKIPFTELSKELQEKYHYDPGAAQKFAIQTAEEIKAANANAEELRKKAAAEARSAIRSIGPLRLTGRAWFPRASCTSYTSCTGLARLFHLLATLGSTAIAPRAPGVRGNGSP
jgi:uncharacterized protein YeaO (DUF488 family)